MILLDTHVVIWLRSGDQKRLGAQARQRAQAALDAGEAFISAITFWEVAMLARKNRLALDMALPDWRDLVLGSGGRELAVTGDIALLAGSLQSDHGDPADRMLLATALAHHLTLLTADEKLLRWPGEMPVLDARV